MGTGANFPESVRNERPAYLKIRACPHFSRLVWRFLARCVSCLSLIGLLLAGGVQALGAPSPSTAGTNAALMSAPPGTMGDHLVGIESSPENIRLFRLINNHHTPALDTFFRYYRYLGSSWVLIPLAIYLFFRRRPLLLPMAVAVGIETVLAYTVKSLVIQSRPCYVLSNVHCLDMRLEFHSFPSADAALAFAIAFMMMYGQKGYRRAAWVLYALLIAYERVYLGVHFPLDVTMGALIGILAARIALTLMPGRMEASVAGSGSTSV